MKKTPLLISAMATCLLALSGCEFANEGVTLYDATSRFVLNSFDSEGSIPMPTYRYGKTKEVPYCELGNFFFAAGALAGFKSNVTKDASVFTVTNENGKRLAAIDVAKDTLTVENYEYWTGNLGKLNNGVGPDIATPGDDETGAVHASEKSKFIGTPKVEVYDMKKYGFDFLEQDESCLVPVQLLANIFFRWNATDFLYNGMDFYYSPYIVAGALANINQSYFATNKRFCVSEGVDAISYDPVGEESYRFAYESKEGDATTYHIISLLKDGTGKTLSASSPSEAGKEIVLDGITYTYKWEKQNNHLLVETIASMVDPQTGSAKTVSQGITKIPLRNTFYGMSKRPQAIAEFSYNLLRFQFDNYYGIKDVAGFTDFDAYATSKGVKDKLMSLDPVTYDKALAELTMKDIDDAHTSYTFPSVFTGKTATTAKKYASDYIGERYTNLLRKRTEYHNLRKSALGIGEHDDEALGQGLFTNGSTAVIRFDSFDIQGTYVGNLIEPAEIAADPDACFQQKDVPLGFDASFKRIAQNENIKNVVIDLTCNGGGSVAALPYILAHITSDPTLYVNDIAMGVTKELHYKVDLNHDGVWGGEGDTYEGKYKFYVLTSDFSFSCGNFLPMSAKYSGAKIIGIQSGGGTCSVGAFSDGCGSLYNISSPQLCVYPDGNGFKHSDAGVPVDYELDSSSWYDLTKLDNFLATLG